MEPEQQTLGDSRGGGLTERQRDESIRLLQEIRWGQMEILLGTLEEALWRLAAVTTSEVDYWDEHAEEAGFVDEFSVDEDGLAHMPPRLRSAYIARLIRDLAFGYGAGWRGRADIGDRDPDSPAFLLRSLEKIISARAPGSA